MNNRIANIIVGYIDGLTWIEKLAGMTQVARILQGDAKVEKRYPISCQMSAEDACREGCYDELAPNSKYRSVVYFEDGSFSYRERRGKRLYYESNIRLVAWLNYKLLEGAGCGSTGEYILDIIQALPETPVDIDNMRSVTITVMSQARRDSGIFSRYTYNEFATQYLMVPYDYFALDIKIEFFVVPECHVPDVGGCTECPEVIPVVVPQALELTFNNIAIVPIADISSVSDWNIFFNLPTYGTPFTSVVIDGNTARLYGGENITFRGNANWQENGNPISVIDNAHCITFLTNQTFAFAPGFEGSSKYTHFIFPAVLSVSDDAFMGNIKVQEINLSSCVSLGSSTINNNVFQSIIGATITLTVPAALMTCNGGNPDGDIAYLIANNTVTIIQV